MNKRVADEEEWSSKESDDEFDPSNHVKRKGVMAKRAAPKRKALYGNDLIFKYVTNKCT